MGLQTRPLSSACEKSKSDNTLSRVSGLPFTLGEEVRALELKSHCHGQAETFNIFNIQSLIFKGFKPLLSILAGTPIVMAMYKRYVTGFALLCITER